VERLAVKLHKVRLLPLIILILEDSNLPIMAKLEVVYTNSENHMAQVKV